MHRKRREAAKSVDSPKQRPFERREAAPRTSRYNCTTIVFMIPR